MKEKTTNKKSNLNLKIGVSSRAKTLDVSGDNYICGKISDDTYMVAISDGMGTGREAAKGSGLTLDILFHLLQVGIKPMVALKSINSILPLHNKTECFTTVDLCLLNLNSGQTCLYKIGAAPTLIKRGGEMGVIKMPTLPMGIIEEIPYNSIEFPIEKGDELYFFTDGVTEASPSDGQLEWAQKIITEFGNSNPQIIADRLLWGATLKYGQAERDDMTVLSVKVS